MLWRSRAAVDDPSYNLHFIYIALFRDVNDVILDVNRHDVFSRDVCFEKNNRCSKMTYLLSRL